MKTEVLYLYSTMYILLAVFRSNLQVRPYVALLPSTKASVDHPHIHMYDHTSHAVYEDLNTLYLDPDYEFCPNLKKKIVSQPFFLF